jgi:hypothetical protein
MNKEVDFFDFQSQNKKDFQNRIRDLEEENEFTEKLSNFLFILGSRLNFDFHFEYIGWNHFIYHFNDNKIIYQKHFCQIFFSFVFI